MLLAASYGEYNPILELVSLILVRLCTLGCLGFAQDVKWPICEQNALLNALPHRCELLASSAAKWRSRKAPRTHTQKAAI